eukprot:CAMPEP_0195292016 /NCGR_PEP_ID=MMETSP0707-20130614/8566_1 /TAXON_ID=33640 /ORGANISM="Asterionellopsis glacialis, Strain CCMP134" /LENGTH=276 /DNA_ID=CAMNT_0040352393 /DNA_START=12 /DNA_END=842 /DNA_ORIENTATION=-
MVDVKTLSIALVSGTGRMGVHLSAAWAHAGMDVIMCSRTKENAQVIVESLLEGKGYSKGDIMVPPTDHTLTQKWKLRPGTIDDAANADVIVLCSPFHVMWPSLGAEHTKLLSLVKGKGKIFMDLTNPWLNTSNKNSKNEPPIPPDEPQASVLYHKKLFDDPTSSWCMAYRHVFWALIHPTGPNPRTGTRNGIEVIGDERAVETCAAIIESHGFKPVIREGGIDVAPKYEVSFTGRVCKDKIPDCPPPTGSDPDGLIGPFSASPMIAVDIMKEKFCK